MKGAFWIVGIGLLIAMFIGVRVLFPGTPTDVNISGGDVNAAPDKIIAWGNFDVEKGVVLLYPRQFGNVSFVHLESTRAKDGDRVKVKKDELLLQVDDAMAKIKVLEAQADVMAGEQQLAKAKKLPELYKSQKEQQKSAIQAVFLDVEKTKRERDSKLLALKDSPSVAEQMTKFYQFGLDQLAEKKKVEEATLFQLEMKDPNIEIKMAEADLVAKNARLKQAQLALDYFKILAPSDGYVLRVHTREGETLGPNPRAPAIEFVGDAPVIVRAEVLQEWGRHVKPGAEVIIEDDTYKGPEWKGVVKKVSGWYATIRSPIIEPFRYNDVRTLECIIEVTDGDTPKLIGQRVRARIKIEK